MHVTNLMLCSLDGEIATRTREDNNSRLECGLSNRDDHALLQDELRRCDAAIMGAETLRADGEVLALKNAAGAYPIWLIFTKQGIEEGLGFWSQNHVPRVLISEQALQPVANPQVKALSYGHEKPGRFALSYLQQRGAKNILLLGGGHINRMFYEEGLVDELKLTIAPFMIGRGVARLVNSPLSSPQRFHLLSCRPLNDFLYLHYKVLPSSVTKP